MKKHYLIIGLLVAQFIVVGACMAAGIEQSNPYIQWMRTTVSSTFTANRVAMTATVAVIKAAPATGSYRHSIMIKNLDTTNAVYIGGSGVTAATGFPVKAGETVVIDRTFAAIYGICDTGLTASVAYLED